MISVQLNSNDKEQATKILKNLGLSMSTYINMAIKQLIINNGIPFELSLNGKDYLYQYFTKKELEETAKELKYMENHPNEYKSFNNVKELKEDLSKDE